MPGFPIRTPWDHSLVDSSPRPIAASHVLHRLLVPRHPPSALGNLTTKMLASTVQFSNNDQPPSPGCRPHPEVGAVVRRCGSGTRKDKQRLFLQDPTGCLQRQPQPHPTPVPHPTRRQYLRTAGPLPAPAHQCLRQRAPLTDTRGERAPEPTFAGRCSLERR